MDIENAKLFDMTEEQLIGVYEEILVLSKKNPDSPINKFKLKFINEFIANANLVLGEDYRPLKDFITFADEDLPSSSDVVFILTQYLKVMDKFRYDHTNIYSGHFYWSIGNDKHGLQTKRPKYLRFE
jgi:hypothetical protein